MTSLLNADWTWPADGLKGLLGHDVVWGPGFDDVRYCYVIFIGQIVLIMGWIFLFIGSIDCNFRS